MKAKVNGKSWATWEAINLFKRIEMRHRAIEKAEARLSEVVKFIPQEEMNFYVSETTKIQNAVEAMP
jgi:hypothetical protein